MRDHSGESPRQRPRVVILGAGFAGITAARRLRRAPVHVTLIDRRNHHLFQPLLYQVATAALTADDVAQPIRHLLRDNPDAEVFWDSVTAIDREAKEVITAETRVPYDRLIVATGARYDYFGNDHWAAHAPGLKSVEDAFLLRRRLLGAFERAEKEPDPERRRALLDFVVVGGGPAGVEMAGAMAELAKGALPPEFRRVDPEAARIRLLEAGPRVLAGYPSHLSERARADLERLGVEVLTDTPVEDLGEGWVRFAGTAHPVGAAVWTAGVAATPAADWLGAPAAKGGRIPVDGHLRLPGDPSVFVVGDLAAFTPEGAEAPLPGLAPVAKQMGAHVARVVRAEARGQAPPPPFRYRDWGIMATIGRNKAVADFHKVRLTGFPAWVLWSMVHVGLLEGVRERLSVGLSWAWSYVTWQHGARVIVGGEPEDGGPLGGARGGSAPDTAHIHHVSKSQGVCAGSRR